MKCNEYFKKFLISDDKLNKLINQSSKNEMMTYLKKDITKIFNTYYEYDTYLSYYLFYINEIEIKTKAYQKLIQSQIAKINFENENLLKNLNKNKKIITEKKKILKILKKNIKNILILNNMIFSYQSYKNEIEYSKYKKINYNDLQTGDILLTIKTDKIIKKKPINKLIKLITKSHIIHSTLFYEKKDNKYFFLDIPKVHYLKKTKYKKFRMNYSKNEVGLVLRKKRGLSKSEKKIIKKVIKTHIGYEYGTYKALLLALKIATFNLLPTYKNLENKIFENTSYCSENVVRIYEKAGIYLGNKSDEGTVTPVDLVNSSNLKIVGYINTSQKNIQTKHIKSQQKNKTKSKY